jgi:hypothetical protein
MPEDEEEQKTVTIQRYRRMVRDFGLHPGTTDPPKKMTSGWVRSMEKPEGWDELLQGIDGGKQERQRQRMKLSGLKIRRRVVRCLANIGFCLTGPRQAELAAENELAAQSE